MLNVLRALCSMLGCMFLVSQTTGDQSCVLTFRVDIADYIYKKTVPLDLSLQGIWIGDRE